MGDFRMPESFHASHCIKASNGNRVSALQGHVIVKEKIIWWVSKVPRSHERSIQPFSRPQKP